MTNHQALKRLARLAVIPTLKRLAYPANMLDMDGYRTVHSANFSQQRRLLLEAWYALAGPAGVEDEAIDEILYKLWDCGVKVRVPEPQQVRMKL